jgi:hypothetical protein
MKRSLLLHIGPHKTGTTYIQQAFSEAVVSLRRHAIHYPLDHEPAGHGQHSITRQLTESQHSVNLADYLKACPAEHDVLLSSENFSRLAAEAVAGLGSQLGEWNVVVVYTVRPVADALFSNWQQQCKVGRTETWSEFLLSHLSVPADSSIINPMPTLAAFQRAFPGSIRLLDYAGLVASQKNIANAVIEAGLNRELPEFSAGAANPSLPIGLAEVLRALNVMHSRKTGKPSKGFRVYRAARKLLRKPSDELKELNARVDSFSFPFEPSALCASLPLREKFELTYRECFTGPRSEGIPTKTLRLPKSEWLQDCDTLDLLSSVYGSLEFGRPRATGPKGMRALNAS